MAPTPTFHDRLDDIQRDLRGTGAVEPDVDSLTDDVTTCVHAISRLCDMVGVLSDLVGSGRATERVQAVEAAHAKERFARLALAAVAEESPCTFPKAWSGHDNINDAIEPEDVPDEYVARLVARFERQQARREAQS